MIVTERKKKGFLLISRIHVKNPPLFPNLTGLLVLSKTKDEKPRVLSPQCQNIETHQLQYLCVCVCICAYVCECVCTHTHVCMYICRGEQTSPVHQMMPLVLVTGIPLHSTHLQGNFLWKYLSGQYGMPVPWASLPPPTLTTQSHHHQNQNTGQATLLYKYLWTWQESPRKFTSFNIPLG